MSFSDFNLNNANLEIVIFETPTPGLYGWIKDKEQGQAEFTISMHNVFLKDILTFKLPEKKKMDFVLSVIQKVSLHHQTRLSQVSCGISWLMMISDVQVVISHLLKTLEYLKRQCSS